MKRFYNSIILGSLLVAGMVSCQQERMEDLKGIWPAPTEVAMSQLSGVSSSKSGGYRSFLLSWSDGGNVLSATLIGSDYFLTPTTYTAAVTPQARTFLMGETSVNGKPVESGSIIVGKSGDSKTYSPADVYSVSALLFCADGSVFKINWEGPIAFDPDPEPVMLTQVFTAQNNLASGVQSVTLSLGSADISSSFDAATWTTVWSGNGNYLAVDLYSADGYLHEGTYTASAVGGVVNPGEFGIGYDTEFWGMTMYNWGTCWWTVDNGVTSAEKITSGTITVEQKGSTWIITWGDESTYPRWARFEGPIEALTNTGGGGSSFDGVELTKFCGSSDYTGWGMNLAGVELGTDGITVEAGAWGNTYGGDGNYLKLEFYSTDGTLAPGEYKACAEGGVIGESEFGIGYDGMFGASGTTWYTLTGGVSTYEYVTDGSLKVEKDGEVYTIVLESSLVNVKYVGKLSTE